ncbi:hypothetical protein AAMO2058_001084500 [Amorphochlora amoebiformis]
MSAPHRAPDKQEEIDKHLSSSLQNLSIKTKEGKGSTASTKAKASRDTGANSGQTGDEDETGFEVSEEEESKEGITYLHIDIKRIKDGKSLVKAELHRALGKLMRRINSYMLRKNCYDPRRLRNFLDPTNVDNNGVSKEWNLTSRRKVAVHGSSSYYELWRTPRNFKIQDFISYLAKSNVVQYYRVHIVRILDDDGVPTDELIRYP